VLCGSLFSTQLPQGWHGMLLTATALWSRCRGGHSRSTRICRPEWTPQTGERAPGTPEQQPHLIPSAGTLLKLLHLCFSASSTPAFPGLFSGTAVPSRIWFFHVWPEMAFLLMAALPLHAGSGGDDNVMFPCKLCMRNHVLFCISSAIIKLARKPFRT